jgi:hypothetical protein
MLRGRGDAWCHGFWHSGSPPAHRCEQAAQIAIASLLILPSLSLPPLEFCLGTSPIQAEKSLPDRNIFGSATLATRAVISARPTPGISSSRRLASLERCQALIIRSTSRICAFNICSWAPRAMTQARATSDSRLSFVPTAMPSAARHHRAGPVRRFRTQQDERGWR